MLLPVLQHAQDGRQWSVRSAESEQLLPVPACRVCEGPLAPGNQLWEKLSHHP